MCFSKQKPKACLSLSIVLVIKLTVLTILDSASTTLKIFPDHFYSQNMNRK